MQDLIVLDAVIAWRDNILKKDIFRRNKTERLSHLSRFIAKGLLNIRQPLSEFIHSNLEDKLRIIDESKEWSNSTKQVRRTTLRSFYKFAKEKKIKRASVVIYGAVMSELLSSNEDKARSQSLTDKEMTSFLNEMFILNPRDGLVTWMMWELKRTIHQILDLRIGDIDLEKGIIVFGNEKIVGNLLPELKRCIQEEGKGKEELLFTTGNGNRIHAGQFSRSMKIASKRAKLPIIITPKILFIFAKAYNERMFMNLSEDERNLILEDCIQKGKALGEKR